MVTKTNTDYSMGFDLVTCISEHNGISSFWYYAYFPPLPRNQGVLREYYLLLCPKITI